MATEFLASPAVAETKFVIAGPRGEGWDQAAGQWWEEEGASKGGENCTEPLHCRWLVVKDSFLLYMCLETGAISFVQLFDPGFEVQVGKRSTEARYGVRIDTSHR